MTKRRKSVKHRPGSAIRWQAILCAVCLVATSVVHAAEERNATKKRWISLFNGKDLKGWTPKFAGHELGINYKNTFRVENGVLKASYDQYDKFDSKFGHIFYKDKFSHYILRFEYRFIGEQCPGGPGWAIRNNGAMLHCQDPKTIGKNQNFPVSIEGQLLGGDGKNKRSTGNLCTPGTNVVMNGKLITQHCINSKSKTYHGDQWVTAEFQVHGDTAIKHLINGEIVMEYQQPQLDPNDADGKKLIKNGDKTWAEGWIAFQAESHPCEFRKIELMPLEE